MNPAFKLFLGGAIGGAAGFGYHLLMASMKAG